MTTEPTKAQVVALLQETRQNYKALRAAIWEHMDAHGYPHLEGDEADHKLWSVLDRA